MRYLSLFTPDPKTMAGMNTPEHRAAMTELVDDMNRAGVLLSTGAFLASSLGARVRASEGRVTVVDAPPLKPDDKMVGFALLAVSSKAEAIEMAKRFLKVAGDGECELRPLLDGPPED